MIKLLIVTSNNDPFSTFAASLDAQADIALDWAASGADAISRISQTPVDLVVVNEHLEDMPGLEFIEKMLSINPMINSAVVSSLTSEEFHEASEGLGILAQLPLLPDAHEADDLVSRLKGIYALSSQK